MDKTDYTPLDQQQAFIEATLFLYAEVVTRILSWETAARKQITRAWGKNAASSVIPLRHSLGRRESICYHLVVKRTLPDNCGCLAIIVFRELQGMPPMPLSGFHPIVSQWFADRFGEPTEPQRLGWPAIAKGRDTLIAAPTGSGKTLSAFLSCIDDLFRQALEGRLTDETQVVYVSPLKALSNDIHRNLEVPLEEIRLAAAAAGYELPPIRAQVRTGDTPASQRQKMLRKPPHLIVTTPESLYLLLTAEKSRENLRTVHTVIVDEIHALARDKRGSHLALSLERLSALANRRPVRIGLSATQRPIDQIAHFLVGTNGANDIDGSQNDESNGDVPCQIVDTGHARHLDLAVEVPPGELSAVCSHETWAEIYERITELIDSHRSTLIFVNTRRLAERVAHHLSERMGDDAVASHHGSLSRELRLAAEERLKSGKLKVIVATASLELGIDVGFIDLVCQIGSPRAIATMLQRVGRSGHSLGVVPKGRLFPLTRDDLLECMANVRAFRQGRLDAVEIPVAPLDILAQQIVAATACEDWDEEELYELCRGAWPYRDLRREDYEAIVHMVSEGIDRSSRRGAYLHRDAVNRRLRARRGARLAALTNAGAIPEMADYRVVTAEERTLVGTVNEDFAIESMAGDVFQLGNMSWLIRYVRGGEVVVQDAKGAPATMPFWLGEAPGRTIELSAEVSQLRSDLAERTGPPKETIEWLIDQCGASRHAAQQALEYVAAQVAAVGVVPTFDRIVFERFFDESGGMQLVIHSPFGARINRAWGLAMRKRFCRGFNFELQASADDNGIVLSLGPQHSFPIDTMFRMLNLDNAEPILVQALLDAPMFEVRWRWNTTRALAVLRFRSGKKVPPPLQRMQADNLLSAVFPNATACLENIVGDIAIPDHPLVRQTVYDCLHEAMDLPRWQQLLADIAAGRIELVARDTREPSPFCYELLNANPYAFLDDAPLEERRARAVATRRSLSADDLRELGRLDPEAIAQVRADAQPTVRNADELHDTLLLLGALPAEEGAAWREEFDSLIAAGRATMLHRDGAADLWVAAERLSLVTAAFEDATIDPPLELPPELMPAVDSTQAGVELVHGRIDICGPVTGAQLASDLGLETGKVLAALEALEGDGSVLRGRFTPEAHDAPGDPDPGDVEWCQRRLLARIHRLTLDGARRQIQPVDASVFLRFLVARHQLEPGDRRIGLAGTAESIAQLQGFELPAGAWEQDILPARVSDYDPAWLDELMQSGEAAWGRLQPPRRSEESFKSGAVINRTVPISLIQRDDLAWLLPPKRTATESYARSNALAVYEALQQHGALFFSDLLAATGLLAAQADEALAELSALGLVTADRFEPIRRLVAPNRSKQAAIRRRRRRTDRSSRRGGRWSRFPWLADIEPPKDRVERWARQLLARYGVVFRDLLTRETVAPAWWELVRVYRRMEARGQIRGGRFVANVAGEQYAEAAAITQLRHLRKQPPTDRWLVISAADPLNLFGVIEPGARIPATRTNALAMIDGRLVASREGGETRFHQQVSTPIAEEIAHALRQSTVVRQRKEGQNHDGFVLNTPSQSDGRSRAVRVTSGRSSVRRFPTSPPRPR